MRACGYCSEENPKSLSSACVLIARYDTQEETSKIGSGARPSSSASSRSHSVVDKNPVGLTNTHLRNKSDLQFSDTDSVSSVVSSRTGQPESLDDSPRDQNVSVGRKLTNPGAKEKLLAKRQKRKDRTFQQEKVTTSNIL